MDARHIGACAELACLLEVAAPKPGNVNRFRDFSDTRFEHFLASAVALRGACEDAASRGFEVEQGSLAPREIGLGSLIKRAVIQTRAWHGGKNTNLGIAILLIPLSASAGLTAARGELDMEEIRDKADYILKESSSKDTVDLYHAIREASPGGMGKQEDLDVNEEKSIKKILKNDINLYEIMCITKNDSIAKELTNKYEITFKIGYDEIMKRYIETNDIIESILCGYMRILSEVPDTLISRKMGAEKAGEISLIAANILEGGMDRKALSEFDDLLRSKGNLLNPGTTADLTASSLMVALLDGVRP
jgi:triphosphoribosyl-dephospho-CoA synthase